MTHIHGNWLAPGVVEARATPDWSSIQGLWSLFQEALERQPNGKFQPPRDHLSFRTALSQTAPQLAAYVEEIGAVFQYAGMPASAIVAKSQTNQAKATTTEKWDESDQATVIRLPPTSISTCRVPPSASA